MYRIIMYVTCIPHEIRMEEGLDLKDACHWADFYKKNYSNSRFQVINDTNGKVEYEATL